MTTRTCPACGWRFGSAEPGQVYCSDRCAGSVAMASLLAGLRRLAGQQQAGGR